MNKNKKDKRRMEKSENKSNNLNQLEILPEYDQVILQDKLNDEPIIKSENVDYLQTFTNTTLVIDVNEANVCDTRRDSLSNKVEEQTNLEDEHKEPHLDQEIIQEPVSLSYEKEAVVTAPILKVNEIHKIELNSSFVKFSKDIDAEDIKYLDKIPEKNYIKSNKEFSSETSQLDKDSFDSRPNSILEFFSSSRQDNAKRIQSQIVDLQTNALCYTKSLIKLAKDFYKIKKGLNSTTNNIFNYLFSLFGYTYRSNFENSNLFIFSTQSWLIILGNILESKIKIFSEEEKQKFKYSNLLEIIRTEMQQITGEMEEAFLYNLGVLTGNLLIDRACSSTTTLMENNIGRSFLKFISESIKADEEFYSKSEVDKKQFEEIIMNLLQKSVEATLNSEYSGDDKEYIDFIHLFDELKCEMLIKSNSAKDIKITIDDYFEYVINSEKFKRKDISELKLAELKICTEAFYIFSQARIYEIILDARLFIRNYSSIVYKSKRFLDQSLTKCINFAKQANVIYAKIYNIIANLLQTERITYSFNYISRRIAKKCAIAVKTRGRDLTALRTWLNNSYNNLRRYKPLFIVSNLTTDMVKYSLEVPQAFYGIIVEKCYYGCRIYSEIKDKVYEFIQRKCFTNFREYIYLKEHETDERFVIVLNRRFMNLCPMFFVRVFEIIRNLLRNSYDIAKDLRMSILDKYRRLLNDSAERKDINSDCNLKGLKNSSCQLDKVKVN